MERLAQQQRCPTSVHLSGCLLLKQQSLSAKKNFQKCNSVPSAPDNQQKFSGKDLSLVDMRHFLTRNSPLSPVHEKKCKKVTFSMHRNPGGRRVSSKKLLPHRRKSSKYIFCMFSSQGSKRNLQGEHIFLLSPFLFLPFVVALFAKGGGGRKKKRDQVQ